MIKIVEITSVDDDVMAAMGRLSPQLQYMFKKKDEFESRTAYSLTYVCDRALC